MREYRDVIFAYSIMLGLIILVGFLQSWSIALSILCFCLISAVMTMGANIQWGYAGLINFGIMGYTALGGLAAVLVSVPPVREAWKAGGLQMILSVLIIVSIVFSVRFIIKKFKKSSKRNYGITFVIITGLILLRLISGPAIESIEAISPATTGFFRGHGSPNFIFLDCWGIFCRSFSIHNRENCLRTQSGLFSNCNIINFRNCNCSY